MRGGGGRKNGPAWGWGVGGEGKMAPGGGGEWPCLKKSIEVEWGERAIRCFHTNYVPRFLNAAAALFIRTLFTQLERAASGLFLCTAQLGIYPLIVSIWYR